VCNKKVAKHKLDTRVGKPECSTSAWFGSNSLVPSHSWLNPNEWTSPANKDGADGYL
jgi:hypothetical protein